MRARWIAAGLLMSVLAGLGFYAVAVEPFAVERVDLRVSVPGLPAAFEGYKLLHLSDFEAISPGRREARVAAIAREARPDLIVVTGDLIRKDLPAGRKWRALEQMTGYLGSLRAPDGVWFAQGHGESASRLDEEGMKRTFEKARVGLLLDDVKTISRAGASIALAGIRIHDYGSEGRWGLGPSGTIQQGPGKRPAYLEMTAEGCEGWTDYDFTGRARFSSPEDWVGLLAHSRLGQGQDRFYMAVRRGTMPFLGVSAHGTTYDDDATAWSKMMRAGVWHRFRLRVQTLSEAVRMRARTWEDGMTEPPGWDLDLTDSAPTRIPAGTAGVYAEGPGVKEFADLRVTRGAAEVADGDWREPAGADFLMDLRSRVPASAPLILLSHTPDIFPEAAELGIPLVLSGHTQGGQVNLPLLGPLVTDTRLGRDFAGGLFVEGDSALFVTRGIGTSRIPLRFLCPPEAAVIELTGSRPS